jgi:2-oxoglutarate dehydrogenase E1 component
LFCSGFCFTILQITVLFLFSDSRVAPCFCSTMLRLFRSVRPVAQAQLLRRGYASLADPSESFLNGTSAVVLESMYEKWERDPKSVDASWARYFESFQAPSLRRPVPRSSVSSSASASSSGASSGVSEAAMRDSIKLMQMIRAYRMCGHLEADLDPLGLQVRGKHPELDPNVYGFSSTAAETKMYIGTELGAKSLSESYEYKRFGDIISKLRSTYCRKVGVEYFHITDVEKRDWLTAKMEHGDPYALSKDQKRNIFTHLAYAEEFESFLAQKYNTAKRFGLEGGEATIPSLEIALEAAADGGVECAVIGMAHRGRLNVLANVLQKPFQQIFHEFKGEGAPGTFFGSGDVKYHLGTSADRSVRGKNMHVSMASNPSHLEFVNPVVEGKTRAKQHFSGDTTRSRNMSILIHGDASFAGQGVVPETLAMQDLKHYSTGGTLHLIINNQIGFTTDPINSRSSPYPSDVAKTIGAPIFHVNGDDPEAVAFVSRIAVEWRQRFKQDVVIDLICYRRHGHNELDQPMFTQPLMYQRIKDHPSTLTLYENKLVSEGTFTREELSAIRSEYVARLEREFVASKDYRPRPEDWLEKNWVGFKTMSKIEGSPNTVTGVDINTLRSLGSKVNAIPEKFEPHTGIARVYKQRQDAMASGKNIDWALAETLAFATLVKEGYPVRLSGQDSERGTFSHRHAVIHDQRSGATHCPLSHVDPAQAVFRVTNSHLSEAAVLGFELGYSLEHPKVLVLWEAQFGDFANGAQVIIDQFICCGEAKWYRQSGLTMLLPHGYDGQGPEHSSARLERFLQLVDEDAYVVQNDAARQEHAVNMSVVNITTPANYFHVLRRQVCRDFRKPLIVMSPKKLLRHKGCLSSLEEFAPDVRFRPVLPNETSEEIDNTKIKRVLLCSGQVYFDLRDARAARGLEKEIAIVRVEQLAPFPFSDIATHALRAYPNAEVVWVQEEPMNQGGWSYIEPRLNTLLEHTGVSQKAAKFIGRSIAAAPATGFIRVHEAEQARLVQDALTL